MGFKVTPARGKDIYPVSDKHNTWSGPIAGPAEDGKYHAVSAAAPDVVNVAS
jgi:hypothetical protein